MRKILLHGEVNEDMLTHFSRQLDELHCKSSTKPITIELCSGGGQAYVALAIYGRIRSAPMKFICKAYGYVQSAATLILSACEDRYAHADTWFMTHEENGATEALSTSALQKVVIQQANEERHWNELLSQRTGKTANYWRELSERTTYFKALEGIKHGLVHKIIANKDYK